MALIEWTNALSVGIDSVDSQHKKLIGMINELNDAMGKGKGNDALGKIFGDIVSYTATHFAHEEKHFGLYKYPDEAKHKAEHAELVKKALELQATYKGGTLAPTLATMTFLKDWLSTHIMKSDKAYSAYMVSKGMK